MRSRSLTGGFAGCLAAAALLISATTSAEGSAEPASACQGVSILSAPQVVVGLADVVISVTGPVDDSVVCQLLPVRRPPVQPRAPRAQHCKNAQQRGYRLRAGEAAKAVRCLINAERTSRGRSALGPRDDLQQAARNHTATMLGNGCFSHQCGGERDLIGRVTTTGYLPCNCSWSVGEDLAWGNRRFSTPRATVHAWMGSPPHRANILSPVFKEVDIGMGSGRPGKRGAKAATYTANFGVRR